MATLNVNLRTDYAPGTEFQQVVVILAGHRRNPQRARVVTVPARPDGRYVEGERVAVFGRLRGRALVNVRILLLQGSNENPGARPLENPLYGSMCEE